MDLLSCLTEIFESKEFPSYDCLFELISKTLCLLENEDSFYRPKEKSEQKLSGGLLNFCTKEEDLNNENGQNQKTVIVVPDLHARAYFLLDILNYKIKIKDSECSVLEACQKKLIYLVCVGDVFHSETRNCARWKKAYAQYKNGVIFSPEMSEEMLENLKLFKMLMTLKLNCPENFHLLKGNHENVLNEEGRGNHPFYKFAREGEMFYRFLFEQYDDAIIYLWSCLEHALPLCAVFDNLVVSHAEPAVVLTKSKIINYRKNSQAVYALTWTANGEAVKGSVSKTIKNLVGKNLKNVVWIGGHRPVLKNVELRQSGKYIQIHNPEKENIAVVRPGTKFNPETDIVCVSGE